MGVEIFPSHHPTPRKNWQLWFNQSIFGQMLKVMSAMAELKDTPLDTDTSQ